MFSGSYSCKKRELFKRVIFGFVIIVLAIVVFLVFCGDVSAKTITVAKDGSGYFEKIQDAIDNASVGDTVFIYNGTYYENVVVNKTINLTGESRENTIIDGNRNGAVGKIMADWVNISRILIKNSGNEHYDTGIEIRNSNNRIINCFISNNLRHGISTYGYSSNNQIINCTISNNSNNGILFEYSMNNQLTNCIISNNSVFGIYLRDSFNNQIIYSTISNNYRSIYFYNSRNNFLRDNKFFNNRHGIQIESNKIEHFIQDIDTSNKVNDKDIYYLIKNNNLTLDANLTYMYFLGMVSCKNITIKNFQLKTQFDTVLIINSTFSNLDNCSFSNNLEQGIYLMESSNNQITKCTISNNSNNGILFENSMNNQLTNCIISNNSVFGIYLYKSSNNQILDSKISNNLGNGIRFVYSTDNQIINCKISNNSKGIYFSHSKNNILKENKFFNNNYEIYISGAIKDFIQDIDTSNKVNGKKIYYLIKINNLSWDGNLNEMYFLGMVSCENITIINYQQKIKSQKLLIINSSYSKIENSTISNSLDEGIYLYESSNNKITNCTISNNLGNGISLWYSSNNQITKCIISNNLGNGISLWYSSNNQITNCIVLDNLDDGIYIPFNSSLENIIHHNNFINNSNQAIDESTNNWDDGFAGNYWSDYIGKDTNKDGIGDVPYNISGGENKDNYPLMAPIKTSLIANFTYSPKNPKIIDTIEFFDISNCIDGNIVSYYWDFGDGHISYDKNTKHKYSQKGKYTVLLAVLDIENSRDECIKMIEIENMKPIANFTYLPLKPISGDKIEFIDKSIDLDGSIISWKWDFGDGKESVKQNPRHRYFIPNAYEVSLSVVDNNGSNDIISFEIYVNAIPPDVIQTHPTNNSMDILVDNLISINFSKPMNHSSVINSIKITPNIAYSTFWEGNTIILTPTSELDFEIKYIIIITIGAKDLADNHLQYPYQFSFTTQLNPLKIFHTPIAIGIEGKPITILAKITDDIAVEKAYLYYRKNNTKNYKKIQMQQKGENYIAEIPSLDITTAGIEYYIWATDGKNNATHPSANPETSPHKFKVNPDLLKNLHDLKITPEDITFSNKTPKIGETITIFVNISNIGEVDATNIEIALYNREELIETKTINEIKAGDCKQISFEFKGKEGTNKIRIIIDPKNKIKELNETNNEAFRYITIQEEEDIPIILYLLISIVAILMLLIFTINLWYPKESRINRK